MIVANKAMWNESRGVSKKIKKMAANIVTIPSIGNDCESLNLSV